MPSDDPIDPAERVTQSLRDIVGAIELIRQWTNDAGGLDRAVHSELVRSAIERQLLIVSEAANRIEQADAGYGPRMAPEIDWRGARGIGNTIRHRYHAVDHHVIQHVVSVELDPLEAACRRLLSQP